MAMFISTPISRAFASEAAMAILAPSKVRASICLVAIVRFVMSLEWVEEREELR